MGKRIVHVEFPAQDTDRAEAFWEGLAGGSIEGHETKQPIPHVAWFARCRDTEGNPFSLLQSDESVAP